MIAMESLPTLTESGAGCAIEWSTVAGCSAPADQLLRMLSKRRFVVLHGAGTLVDDAKAILQRLGTLVDHENRKDSVLELDGSKSEDEVLRGEEYMPLHKDGLLMGICIQWVGIFCEQFEHVTGGRTFISDADSALDLIAPDVIEVLDQHGIEAEAVDSDYYLKSSGQWHPLPALERRSEGTSFNLGLQYREGTRPSWRVRVAGVAKSESDAVFTELERVLMAPRQLYYHDWQAGDLLLFDNQKVLHGRESYTGRRRLANLQVL